MGKPYWGFNNLLTQSSTTISARTESSNYPVTNLGKHRLWPGYRSADKSLHLNGTDEFAYIVSGSETDFRITGDLTLETVIKLDSSGAGTVRRIIDKADASSGYSMLIGTLEEVAIYVNGLTPGASTAKITVSETLTANTYYRIKAIYDASAQEVSVYFDGTLQACVNNSTQTGGTLTGTIPSAMSSNTVRLTIGASSGNSQLFYGSISFATINNTENDHGGYVNPDASATMGYWNFDSSDLTNSSGNENTLTGAGITAGNYQNCAAFQWVRATFSPSISGATYLFIDRRHNLSSYATIRLLTGSVFSLYHSITSASVTAGEPVVLSFTIGINGYAWLEIRDPGSPGYIELPYVYLGDSTFMQRAHLRGYNHGQPSLGNVVADSGGGYTAYARSEKLWSANLRFRCNSTDFTTLQSVLDTARLMRPVVFSEDGSEEKTRLVYLPEAMKSEYQHILTNHNFVDIALQEAGGGL